MDIKVHPIKPDFKRKDGLWVASLDTIKLPKGFNLYEKYVIYLPPDQSGGNHKHPRTEIFLGIGRGLEFVWLDKSGEKQSEQMNPEGEFLLIEVSPYVPHAVINHSSDEFGVLIEFANAPLEEEEEVKLTEK